MHWTHRHFFLKLLPNSWDIFFNQYRIVFDRFGLKKLKRWCFDSLTFTNISNVLAKNFFFYSQVISNIKRSIRSSRSRSFSTSKRMNQTQQQTLSIRSEYDVTKNGDQCYKSLIAPTADESEVLELKESSRNGDVFHDGSQVDK